MDLAEIGFGPAWIRAEEVLKFYVSRALSVFNVYEFMHRVFLIEP